MHEQEKNKQMKKYLYLLLLLWLLHSTTLIAQEKIFAGYFDISAGSEKGEQIIGKIHLERNKDVLTAPIPKSYYFEIAKQMDGLFKVETIFDPMGRITGVFTAAKEIKNAGTQLLTIRLKDGAQTLNEFPVTIRVVKETLWQTLFERYKDVTLTHAQGRMYGRKKPKDAEVADAIEQLETTGGEFKEFGFYHQNPIEYKPVGKSIEFDWEAVGNSIGGLGYAYATSKIYGPEGNSSERERLKRVLYSTLIAYTNAVPVEGKDVVVKGKPIGNCTGDGFANLKLYNKIEEQVVTHQWVISDGLIVPAVHIMPDLLNDIKKGDQQAAKVYYSLVRIYQTAMAEVANRRAVDDPAERWGKITDTLRSSGAWADANLGHRSRMMLALPIIWADYNRPMTYVQYWYSDYYKDQPFKGFSFSPGWSPHGVVFDVARWLTKYNVAAHQYKQSGFQPDGTVSHHIANGTDAAMIAYGFEWLTDAFTGFNQFKNTELKLSDPYYQFPADRLLQVYPKLIYNGSFDFLVSGRSYDSDMKKFVASTYLDAIKDLKQSQSKDTKIADQKELDETFSTIKNNTFQYSGTDAYWVNEFLVHRGGLHEKSFYVSLKLKSKRTVGAEDFGKVRKSWYLGYGILPLKVTGDEYARKVLLNMDWHALPGLTEEWRTDPIPVGHAQASLPGKNDVSGVTANGKTGMGIYHHLPGETYSSATACKTYHFMPDKIIALGSRIARNRPGQGKEIVTTIDQSALLDKLVIFHDGKKETILPTQSVNRSFETEKPVWFYTGQKGYIIYPEGNQTIIIKTGKEINKTDRSIGDDTPNYIVAINHGIRPANGSYYYVAVPNANKITMPALVNRYVKELIIKKEREAHAIYDNTNKVLQAGFFSGGKITVAGNTISSEQPAELILQDDGDQWKLTIANPVPSLKQKQLIFYVSQALKPGKYEYSLGGIYPRKGEFVSVTSQDKGSKIVAELADEDDEAFYNYQAELYNAAPVTITIPKR